MNPYSCPICNSRPALFFKYPLICGKCWPGIRNDVDAARQLQMRLTFYSSIKLNQTVASSA